LKIRLKRKVEGKIRKPNSCKGLGGTFGQSIWAKASLKTWTGRVHQRKRQPANKMQKRAPHPNDVREKLKRDFVSTDSDRRGGKIHKKIKAK